jgi:hypothetical protein
MKTGKLEIHLIYGKLIGIEDWSFVFGTVYT